MTPATATQTRLWTGAGSISRLTLAVLNSAEFVDRTPLQAYAVLLERGEYLCSVSTIYRILAANAQVKDRRRLARHPARARPELIATGPGQVFT